MLSEMPPTTSLSNAEASRRRQEAARQQAIEESVARGGSPRRREPLRTTGPGEANAVGPDSIGLLKPRSSGALAGSDVLGGSPRGALLRPHRGPDDPASAGNTERNRSSGSPRRPNRKRTQCARRSASSITPCAPACRHRFQRTHVSPQEQSNCNPRLIYANAGR